jgi:predicted Zn-dependent protease
VLAEITKNFVELSLNRNGLCVIKILIAKTKDPNQQQSLMSRISKDIMHLVCHPFGNYAITQIVTNWPNKTKQVIFKALKNKLYELSMQKYSSNVIENCLERSDPQTRSEFIIEISNSDKLANLIKHSYGNYVVQKALKIAQG